MNLTRLTDLHMMSRLVALLPTKPSNLNISLQENRETQGHKTVSIKLEAI